MSPNQKAGELICQRVQVHVVRMGKKITKKGSNTGGAGGTFLSQGNMTPDLGSKAIL